MSATVPPAGIFVPVPTFFTPAPALALDHETQLAHSLFLARAGVKGLVLLGSTGEAIHLTRNERTDLIKSVRSGLAENGFPSFPLMAGTATQNIDETLQLISDAKEAGADYALVLAPGYFAGAMGGQEGIVGWFTEVADKAVLPVLIYHYPGVSNNVVISPATIRKLAKHRNIVGAKFSHGDVSVHAQVALDPEIDHESFAMYTGLGQQLLPVVAVGAAGAIDGLANIFPKAVVKLYQLAAEGGGKEAKALQWWVSCAEEVVVKGGVPAIKEAVRVVAGLGDGGVRVPLVKSAGLGEWTAIVERFQEVEAKVGKGVALA